MYGGDTELKEDTAQLAGVGLSEGQERLWFLHNLSPGSCSNNDLLALRFRGALDLNALEGTVNEIVRRHEPLRTSYGESTTGSFQIVHSPVPVPLPVIDCSEISAELDGSDRDYLLSSFFWHPFDLAAGYIFRIAVVRHAPEVHDLLIAVHHIACDGWSGYILRDELLAGYAASSARKRPELPRLPASYIGAARLAREAVNPKLLERNRLYWRAQLAELPEPLLPVDHAPLNGPQFRGAWSDFTLGGDLLNALRNLGRSLSTTLSNVLLATFRLLLYKYSGQRDLAIGMAVAGRLRSESEKLIGFFSDTLVLRLQINGDPSFREMAREISRIAFEGYAHQPMPFQDLVRELQPERELSQNPLYRVVWTYQTGPAFSADLGTVAVEAARGLRRGNALYDLRCLLFDEGDRVLVRFEYTHDLFLDETAHRMVANWSNLIRFAAQHPNSLISTIPCLSQTEAEQIKRWNETEKRVEGAETVGGMFEEGWRGQADAVAVV